MGPGSEFDRRPVREHRTEKLPEAQPPVTREEAAALVRKFGEAHPGLPRREPGASLGGREPALAYRPQTPADWAAGSWDEPLPETGVSPLAARILERVGVWEEGGRSSFQLNDLTAAGLFEQGAPSALLDALAQVCALGRAYQVRPLPGAVWKIIPVAPAPRANPAAVDYLALLTPHQAAPHERPSFRALYEAELAYLAEAAGDQLDREAARRLLSLERGRAL